MPTGIDDFVDCLERVNGTHDLNFAALNVRFAKVEYH